jgi:hypothetical protein
LRNARQANGIATRLRDGLRSMASGRGFGAVGHRVCAAGGLVPHTAADINHLLAAIRDHMETSTRKASRHQGCTAPRRHEFLKKLVPILGKAFVKA